MRLICDENIGSYLADYLTKQGHDVVRAVRVLGEAPDEDVLRFAVAEERVLITCDRDFGELVFNSGNEAPPAIIYVRFEPQDVRDIAPRLRAALESEPVVGNLIVLGEHRDRRSPLPKSE